MKWTKNQFSQLSTVAITAFMSTFLISAISIALPAIDNDFNLGAVKLSWIISAFLLSTAIFLLPAGKIGDQKGIHKLFKTGIFIFTISTFLCGISFSATSLIIFRFIQGIGAALTTTTGPAILVTNFSQKHRGRVLGIAVSAVYLGLATGPFAGGILTQQFGWRTIFHVSTLLGILCCYLSIKHIKHQRKRSNEYKKLEFNGSLLYAIGLSFIIYGSSLIPNNKGWIIICMGLLFITGFLIIEKKSKSPAIDIKLFTHNKLFAYSNLAALINYSSTFAIVFLLSLYLQKIKNLSPQQAGLILVAQPIIMALLSPISGRLSDRIQPRILSSIGMTICAFGLAGLSFLQPNTSNEKIIAILIWEGIGFALFSSPNMNTIMSSVKGHQLGQASGFAATMRVIGQILSMTIASIFFSFFFGNKLLNNIPDNTFITATKWIFLCFTIICLFGIYFSIERGQIRREIPK